MNKLYEQGHWKDRNRIANDYHSYFYPYAKKLKIVSQMKFPIDVEYDFYWLKNSLDSSNCFYMAKMIEDSLVGECFPDDKNKYIRWIKTRSQKQEDKSIKEDLVIIRFIGEI